MTEFVFGLIIGASGTLLAIMGLVMVAICRASSPSDAWRFMYEDGGSM